MVDLLGDKEGLLDRRLLTSKPVKQHYLVYALNISKITATKY
jgi:hypothetical protein